LDNYATKILDSLKKMSRQFKMSNKHFLKIKISNKHVFCYLSITHHIFYC